jgi:autotransporter-associated beta strand protein
LYNFKKINSARALPSVIALPAASNVLSMAVSDTDNGVPAFAWSKVSGAGNVSFNPGGITQSTNCSASFDTPGTYILRVAVVDSSILNSGLWVTHHLGYYDFQTYTNVISAVFTNVTVTVSPDPNRAPVSQNQSLTTEVNTAKAVTLAATDLNGDTLTFSIVTPPAHGALSGNAPNVTYIPTTSYTGFDSFTFKANDGRVDSNVATVTIDVGVAGNRRPVATNPFVTVVEDTAKAITLTGNDPDSDPLTYTILSLPVNGTLSGSAPGMTYTPATNFPAGNVNGSDSFTFVVSDGTLTSAVATVSITVTPVNDSPRALAQSVSVSANTETGITLTGSDPEGYALSYAVASTPSHGTLSGVAPDLTYQPTANYHGSDSFTFRVTDSEGAVSSASTVSITVINDPPVANPQSVEVTPNIAKAIMLTGSDNCNDTLTYTVLTQPVNGVLSGTAPSVTYTPTANYTGSDSFTFKVNDGTQDSVTPATVTVNVVQWQSWTNIASGNWSVGGNWAGGTAPSAGGGADHHLFFNTSGYSGASVNNLSGTFQLNRLTFGSTLPAVTLSGNTLALTNQAAISPQLLQNSANAVALSTPLGLNANTTLGGVGAGTVSLSGVISGTGSLTKTVGGTLTLSSVNTFTGGLTVNAGTLNPHGNGSNSSRAYFGTGTTTLTNGTTLQATDVSGQPVRIPTAIHLSGGSVSVPIPFGGGTDLSLEGKISGPGGLFVYGGTRGLALNGNNTFSGGVTLNDNNNVTINNVNGLGTGPLLLGDASGGILKPSTSLSAGWVTNRIVLSFGGTLTVNTGSGSLRLSGNISDSGALTKSGANTLTLSGVNTYSGPTHVAGGMLVCSNALALGSGTLDISTGAKLQLDYTGTRSVDALTFNNGTPLPTGTYGSSSSPAVNTNNTYFAGTGTVTVGATGQTITFGTLPAKNYGDAAFALTATASSGLTVSYESSDPTVASVAGNMVTILKAGTTTITATQAGDGNVGADTPVPQTLTISKATPVLTWNAPAAIIIGTALSSMQLNATSGGVAGTFTYTPPVGTVLSLGVGQMLSVRFTPTDTETYNSPADMQVAITVTATVLAEDFEHEWTDNALANTTNNWTSGLQDLSSIMNPVVGYDPLPGDVLFPLSYDHAAQKRVIQLNTQGAELVTPPVGAAFVNAKVYVDLMINFEVSTQAVALDKLKAAKVAVFLKAEGSSTNLVVFHGQKSGTAFDAPTFTVVTDEVLARTWYRLTVELASVDGENDAEAFRVLINGRALTSAQAYGNDWKTRIYSTPCTPNGGSWFLSAARKPGASGSSLNTISNLCFVGTGRVDDLVVTYTSPTFVPGTLIMLALSTGSGGEAWMGY